MKKYCTAIILFLVFEVIAIWLWLSTGNLFFLLNFSYLGISIGGGAALLAAGWKYGRELTQFLVGSYLLCSGYHTGFTFQGQSCILQVYLSDNGIPQTYELLLAATYPL